MAIPVGTAIGYGYGGVVSSHLSWPWIFFIEAIPMCPLIALMWVIPYNKKRREAVERVEAEMEAEGADKALLGPHEAAAVTPAAGAGANAHHGHGHSHSHKGSGHHFPHHVPPTGEEINREVNIELREEGADPSALRDTQPGTPSFWQELYKTLTNPIYVAIVLGYAGFTGVVAGIGTFAPTFIVGLKLLDSQEKASLSAGAVVSIAGLIGVPAGGWMLDYGQRRARQALEREKAIRKAAREAGVDETIALAQAAVLGRSHSLFAAPPSSQLLALSSAVSASNLQPDDQASLLEKSTGTGTGNTGVVVAPSSTTDSASAGKAGAATGNTGAPASDDDDDATSPEVLDIKLATALPQCAILAFAGTLFIVGGCFATLSGLTLFLIILATGTLILMGTTAGINLAMMASVPPETRSFAIGMGTMLLHALGDVPAPPIIGAIADKLSPKTCDASGNNCDRSADGLRDTLLATTSWLVWPIVLWAVAWILASRQQAWRRATGWYEANPTHATGTGASGVNAHAGGASSAAGSYVPVTADGVPAGSGAGNSYATLASSGSNEAVYSAGAGSSGSTAVPIGSGGLHRGYYSARSDAASLSAETGSRQSSQMFAAGSLSAAGLGARAGGGALVGSYVPSGGGGSMLLGLGAGSRPIGVAGGSGGSSGGHGTSGVEMNALPLSSSYRAPSARGDGGDRGVVLE